MSKHHALQASKDKLEVRYVGKGNHSHDVGAIRADRPCPQRRVLYYFEVTVLDAGLRGSIAVGLADSTLQLCRQPGWEPNSYGYHGADGRKYTDSERGESYGPAFTTGDVVGCGVLCLSRRQVFFTKNGRHLGDAFVGVGGVLYPTVGLHSPNERVAINFGGSPFKFDCEALVASEREARVEQVAKVPVSDASVHRLVRAYLLHHTYEKTLDALDAATPVPLAANGAPAAAACRRGPPPRPRRPRPRRRRPTTPPRPRTLPPWRRGPRRRQRRRRPPPRPRRRRRCERASARGDRCARCSAATSAARSR